MGGIPTSSSRSVSERSVQYQGNNFIDILLVGKGRSCRQRTHENKIIIECNRQERGKES